MTPILKTAPLGAVLLVRVALPGPLNADPITITGGSVQVEVNITDARISLVGDDFLLRTGTDVFVVPGLAPSNDSPPFPAGSSVNLTGIWLTSQTQGEAIFNGVHYPELFFDFPSGGTFMAPSVTLTGEGLRTFTVPFTFNGLVTAFDTSVPGPDDPPIFTTTLVGSGSTRVAFSGYDAGVGSGIVFDPVPLPGADYQLEYVFSPSAPIPEPGTVVLLGTGVLGMLAARRRSRPRNDSSAITARTPPGGV